MLIDKFRGLIRSDFDRKKILMYSLPIVSFIIGLLVHHHCLIDCVRRLLMRKSSLWKLRGWCLLTEAVMTAPLSKVLKQGRDMDD